MSNEFSLLSLNTFGIPFFLSWGRLGRLARELEQRETTIVCLQEIQQNAYTALLEKRLSAFPYKTFYPHLFTPKGGLGTFSRLPLVSQKFELFRDRGLRYLITFADWALLKGVLVSQLQLEGLDVWILNTHLNANYSGDWRRGNLLTVTQHRQVQQLTHLLGEMPAAALIVLCGDFNFPRASFLYDELVAQNELFDPLRDDPRPTYRPFPLVPAKWKISLDFIFLRLPQNKEIDILADIVPLDDSTQKGAVQRFLTDHCALTLKVQW